ncbi:hypothetical protein F4Y93_08935, partial [Candidatus Poribacteria bacterium]|nr:hypothetical protein [Candidatus Poribacteria bacterium]
MRIFGKHSVLVAQTNSFAAYAKKRPSKNPRCEVHHATKEMKTQSGRLWYERAVRVSPNLKTSMEEKKMRQTFIVVLTVILVSTTALAADHVLIIGGAAGEKSFYDAFWNATSRFHQLLTDEYGYTPDQITFLFEDMDASGTEGLIDTESRREQVLSAFDQLAETLQPSDRFLLFMIGHASRTNKGELKYNLLGRDISEAEYITRINNIPAERQILIFGFPYSGKLVPQLSRPGRIILTSSSRKDGYSLQAGVG